MITFKEIIEKFLCTNRDPRYKQIAIRMLKEQGKRFNQDTKVMEKKIKEYGMMAD